MKVNVEQLKADLKSEYLGAYFGGGFGAALVSYSDVENASTEKLLQMAESFGLGISNYIEDEGEMSIWTQ